MAGYIFFGVLMIGFGIVEMVRSRGMKKRKKEARDREFDMYTMIAEQMGGKDQSCDRRGHKGCQGSATATDNGQ